MRNRNLDAATRITLLYVLFGFVFAVFTIARLVFDKTKREIVREAAKEYPNPKMYHVGVFLAAWVFWLPFSIFVTWMNFAKMKDDAGDDAGDDT